MSVQDESGFETLVLPQMDAVYRVARRLTRDEHEAQDLVQETYLRAFKAFGRFELREFGVRPWLLKILHNAYLNRRLKLSRGARLSDSRALEQVEDDSSTRFVVGPPELDYERLDSEVRTAIDRLPDDFRVVLLLWATMDLSYEEIAEIVGVPIGTVMSRLHRARQKLVRDLHDYAREHRMRDEERLSHESG